MARFLARRVQQRQVLECAVADWLRQIHHFCSAQGDPGLKPPALDEDQFATTVEFYQKPVDAKCQGSNDAVIDEKGRLIAWTVVNPDGTSCRMIVNPEAYDKLNA